MDYSVHKSLIYAGHGGKVEEEGGLTNTKDLFKALWKFTLHGRMLFLLKIIGY